MTSNEEIRAGFHNALESLSKETARDSPNELAILFWWNEAHNFFAHMGEELKTESLPYLTAACEAATKALQL